MTSQNHDWLHADGPRLLLAEGIDDCHVIAALCKAHQLPDGAFVFYAGGSDTGAIRRMKAVLGRKSSYEAIGLVLDADQPDISVRWQQLQSLSELKPYGLPARPDPAGTIIDGPPDHPRLGIWLMPDNTSPGMLEDFLLHLAHPDGIAAARDTVAGVRGQPWAPFRDVHHSKAVIHTWLAWQDEPGKPLGQSITSHALRPHTPIAISFTDWLKRLFNA